MTPSVLVVQHAPHCPPGRVGAWLSAAGCTLDVRRPHAGDPLPSDLDGHDALLVLGGEMGAYDDEQFAWLGPTRRLLGEAVRRDHPTLAVCLGLQLLAVAAGGAVARATAGPQIGLQVVGVTAAAAADPLFAPLGPSARAVHWNNDVVTRVPAGAVRLAETHAGVQAFRLGERVWAVQFHPEVTVTDLRPWAAADVAAGLVDRDQVEAELAAVAAAEDHLAPAWRGFTERFADLVRRPPRAGS